MRETEVRRLQEQLKSFQRRQRRDWNSPGGLTQTAARVVGAIARLPDACSPGMISDDLGLTSSNVAAVLRELATRDLITRSKDAGDTRRTNIHFTTAGEALVKSSRNERDGWLSQAIDALLDADQQALLLEAGVLLERLSRFDGKAGPPDSVAP
jgi:DNA-binding MarR family transcriptional regulator